jgi:hypothetical protein
MKLISISPSSPQTYSSFACSGKKKKKGSNDVSVHPLIFSILTVLYIWATKVMVSVNASITGKNLLQSELA